MHTELALDMIMTTTHGITQLTQTDKVNIDRDRVQDQDQDQDQYKNVLIS